MKQISYSKALGRVCGLGLAALSLALFSCGKPNQRPWQQSVLSPNVEEAGEVTAMELIDLNRDGIAELIICRENFDYITLFLFSKGDGGGRTWQEVKIQALPGIAALHLWNTGTREAPQAELVLAAGADSGQVFSLKVPEGEALTRPEAWVSRTIPVPAGNWKQVSSGDLNNDGKEDLALVGSAGDPETGQAPVVVWMSLPGAEERQVIQIGKVAAPKLLYVEDVEGDGDMDLWVVDSAPGASSMGAFWLENPWPENPEVDWKRNFITLSSLRPTGGQIVDFDGDQKKDLLISLSGKNGANRLMCFKKVTAAVEVAWLPLPFAISGKQGGLTQTEMVDVDQDGAEDLVLGYLGAADPLEHLIWLKNPTAESAVPSWARYAISGTRGEVSHRILVFDIDADRDPDILSAEKGGMVVWYTNPTDPEEPSEQDRPE